MADTTIQLAAGQLDFKGPQDPNSVNLRNIAPGTLSIIGLALTLVVTPPIPVGAGVLTWQGLAPTVDITTPSGPMLGAGSLVWQGLIPTVRVGDVMIDIPAGSIVFKGPQRPQEIPQPQAGALTWQGYTPQVLVNAPGSSIAVPCGSLLFTGQTLDRLVSIAPVLGCGSLVFTGQYVAVAFKGLDAGSLVWQGLAPTVVVNTQGSIAIPAGSLVWTGLQNRIDWSVGLRAGVLTFHGLAPESGQTSTIAIGAGSLLFTGQTPLAVKDIPIALGVGSLIFTSDLAVIPFIDVRPSVGAGALAFTGLVPTVGIGVADTTVSIGAGSLVWTGYTPLLIPSIEIALGAGSLVFTGQTMIVLNGLTVELGAGSLTFQGQAFVAQVLSPFVFGAGHIAFNGQLMRVINSGVTPSNSSFIYTATYEY